MAGLMRLGEQAAGQSTGLMRSLAHQEVQREETNKNIDLQQKSDQISGAASGAMIGGYMAAGTAMGGPVGAAVGAIAGLFLGGL